MPPPPPALPPLDTAGGTGALGVVGHGDGAVRRAQHVRQPVGAGRRAAELHRRLRGAGRTCVADADPHADACIDAISKLPSVSRPCEYFQVGAGVAIPDIYDLDLSRIRRSRRPTPTCATASTRRRRRRSPLTATTPRAAPPRTSVSARARTTHPRRRTRNAAARNAARPARDPARQPVPALRRRVRGGDGFLHPTLGVCVNAAGTTYCPNAAGQSTSRRPPLPPSPPPAPPSPPTPPTPSSLPPARPGVRGLRQPHPRRGRGLRLRPLHGRA